MRFQHGSHTGIHLHGGDPELDLPLVLTGHRIVSIPLPFPYGNKARSACTAQDPQNTVGQIGAHPQPTSHMLPDWTFQMLNPMRIMTQQ